MEIIPIIYTVLEIALFLTIITLAFSFFNNKIKQRKGETTKVPTVNSKKIEQEEIIEDHLKPIPRPYANNREKPAEEKDVIANPKKPAKKVPPQEKPGEKNNASKSPNKRILILKNLSPNPKKETKIQEVKKNIEKEQLNSLGGEILDKYVEEEDPKLYTLNVKVNKDKSK
jgi:hypothetical protein